MKNLDKCGPNFNQNSFLQLLGLAMRAGKLITGEELVIQAIRSRKAKLVILSEDASPNTAKKVIDKCYSYHIDCMKYGDRNQLGQATGKDQRVVLAVTDDGFARKMKTILSD